MDLPFVILVPGNFMARLGHWSIGQVAGSMIESAKARPSSNES